MKMNSLPKLGRRCLAPAHGQVLILFALLLGFVFMGVLAAAVDLANLHAERRRLQNGADAAALAGAEVYKRSGDASRGVAAATQYVNKNVGGLTLSPNQGTGTSLTRGIEAQNMEVRVALREDVDGFFSGAIGFPKLTAAARARAALTASDAVVPLGVKRFDRGRTDVPIASGDTRIDYMCQQGTTISQWPSPLTAPSSCAEASDASDLTKGPSIPLVGPDVAPNAPSNSNSYNGWITLDVRNLAGTPQYYHGVNSSGGSVNSIKDQSLDYIRKYGSYPEDANNPLPSPGDSVATFSGARVGQIVDAMNGRYRPGDKFLAVVYDGTVYRKPDFQLSANNRNQQIYRTGYPANNADYSFQLFGENNFSGDMVLSVTDLPPAYTWKMKAYNGFGTPPPFGTANTPVTTFVSGTNKQNNPVQGTVNISRLTAPTTSELVRFYVVARDVNTGKSRRYAMVIQAGNNRPGYVVFIDTPTINATVGAPNAEWTAIFRAYDGYNANPAYSLTPGGPSGTVNIPGSGSKTITLPVNVPATAGLYPYTFTSGTYTEALTMNVIADDGNSNVANSDFVYILGYALFEIQPPSNNSMWARAVSGMRPSANDFSSVRRAALAPW